MSKGAEIIGLICGITAAIIIGLVVLYMNQSAIQSYIGSRISEAIPGFDSITMIITYLFLFPLFLLLIKKKMGKQSQ
jgi:hypothetical protein